MRCKLSKIPPGVGIYQHIQNLKFLDRAAFCARAILLTITTLIFFPPVFSLIDTIAAPTPSTTTLTLATSDISVEIAPGNSAGTFVASDPAIVSVTTNNYTGYTLSITANNNTDNTKLINTDDNTAYLTSISSASAPADFNANNWGYLPSKLNGAANSTYQPAPTTTATTLETTNTANPTANEYTIALGVKANYTLPEGTYENTFNITAVANPVAYTIKYNKNTEDTVTNLPETQTGDVENTSIYIPNNTPSRDHYTFLGWCTTTPTTTNYTDSCSGTTYQPGAEVSLSQATANNITLHAMWQKYFVQTTQVQYQTAAGSYGGYTTVDTKNLTYGETYSWSTSQISGFDTATYKSNSTSYIVTGDKTNQLSIDRQTYTLTVTRDTGYATIASVSGGGTYRAGQTVSISASTTSGSSFYNWTQTAGNSGSFASAGSASTTFTMPSSAATIKANGTVNTRYLQNYTAAGCPTSATIAYDIRDSTAYHIQKLADGKCWMLDNLAIDLSNSTVKNNLSASNTNATATSISYLKNGGASTSSKYATSGVVNNSSQNSYYSPIIYMNSKTAVPANYVSGSSGYNRYGGFYNYCAATAGSYCYSESSSSGNATEDICPAGWRLPTGGTSGEFRALVKAVTGVNGDTTNSTYVTNFRKALSVALAGHVSSATMYDQGARTLFWSSTRASNSNSYDMDVRVGGGYGVGVYTSTNDNRYYLFNVRCIAK